MDFYSMKRKRLQSLCKKHGIPANLKNKEMADKLSMLFKGKENPVLCQLGSNNAEDMVNVETLELDSNNGTNDIQMVASDIVAGNVDASEEKLTSSGKISPSPDLEQTTDFSAKLLKITEIEGLESEKNLSPELTRVDFGICEVEEKMRNGLNKEEVDDSAMECLHSSPEVVVMDDVDLASKEFGNHLVEAEVEKLGDNTNVCGKAEAEAEKQDDITNNPQGSNRNYLNISQGSPEEFGNPLVQEEVHNSDDNVCVHGAVYNVRNERSEADTMCLDKDTTDGKTNVTTEHFLDEVHSSSFKYSDGTPGQVLQTYPLSEVKSSDHNVQQMVASGTAAGNSDGCEVKFVSSQKISLSPDERIDFPLKLMNNSQIKRLESKTSLSPERRDDIGFFYVEENMQTGVNKEQVDDNQELHPAAPSAMVMEDEGYAHVASEEFGNYLVEGEVEKLGDKTDVHEDIWGTRKVEVEGNKQEHANSPQGSNINSVNLSHVSLKESSGLLVEGEVHKLDDNICVHGAVYDYRNGISEAATVCLDASIGAKDIDWKTNVTVEHILDEVHSSSFEDSDGTPVQFLPTYPLHEVKTSDLDLNKMVVPGTAIRNADTSEAKFVSSQKISISPALEKMIGFSPKLLNNSETPRDNIGICDVEENMQIGVNEGQVDHSQEVIHAAPSVMDMNDEDLVQLASEEFGNHLVEGEFAKLGDKTDILEDVCGTGKGSDETVKQGGINSPQGSNINGVNLLHVSQEESGYPLVEVQKSDDNDFHGDIYNLGNSGSEDDALCLLEAYIAAKDTDGKTNVTMERFPDDVHSSGVKYSDGTSEQFLTTHLLGEMMSSDLNIHQMDASDTDEEMLKSSQQTGLIADLEECIGFSPNNLEASETKGFEAETCFDPSTLGDVVGTCDMKESMQIDQIEKENSEEVFHTTENAMDLLGISKEECNLVQGEVTKLFDNSEVHDDTGGTGAEDENQPYMGSRKRKNSDMDCLQEYFLNEFQPVDNAASGQNSNEKPHEFVPTVPHHGEMKSCTYNLHQYFASDEGTYQEKLESPPKCTASASSEENNFFSPKLLESSMMNKENIKIDKKEQVGSIISKNKFPKRQPLQDLQQN